MTPSVYASAVDFVGYEWSFKEPVKIPERLTIWLYELHWDGDVILNLLQLK